MHFVIGTAGHVDHGKTALIKALTGIETAHLPQEKKRGMTIDLGFAHFKDAQGNMIGVIDVPGHERFIRNMVAGVWSLDLVLFVVAADEGWMPMSSDHLKVITSMGVENILLVITKADLVDKETLDFIEEEALEQFMDLGGILPDCVVVSAHQNTGMDELKRLISAQLCAIERPEILEGAHLCVDRIFTVNGMGTTVTGSLCGGEFHVGQKLLVQPTGLTVQVKSLQSYHKDITRAEAVSRVAVCLKGIKKKELQRGFCLVPLKEEGEQGAIVMDECIVRLDDWPEQGSCRNNSEIEVALGTFNTLAQVFFFKDTRLARLRLKQKASCFWNQRILLIQHGGSRILNSGNILWTGAVARHQRTKLAGLLQQAPDRLVMSDYIRLNLQLYGYAKASKFDDKSLFDSPSAEQQDGSLRLDDSFIRCGDWLFLQTSYTTSQEKIIELLESAQMPLSLVELSSKLGMPASALKPILTALACDGKLRFEEQLYSLGNGRSEDSLSEIGKKILSLIRACKTQGFEADKEHVAGSQKELRNLVRQEFVVPLEDKIYYDSEVYQQLVADIVNGYQAKDRFTISEAKDRTGLSRKFMIPVLNRMEKDGWIKRHDSDREVLRSLNG